MSQKFTHLQVTNIEVSNAEIQMRVFILIFKYFNSLNVLGYLKVFISLITI